VRREKGTRWGGRKRGNGRWFEFEPGIYTRSIILNSAQTNQMGQIVGGTEGKRRSLDSLYARLSIFSDGHFGTGENLRFGNVGSIRQQNHKSDLGVILTT
jgi:hypothetical protein